MKFNGLIAAAFSPFNADGSLAPEKIPAMTRYYIEKELGGIFVCGSTGECSSLCFDERITLAESFINEAAGRIPVIVHVGSNSVQESARLAAHAQASGAEAIAAFSPSYFKPSDINALVASMAEIAAAAPELPFFFYHIPSMTGVNFRMIDFLPKAVAEIPSFAGLKYTHEDLMDYQLCVDYSSVLQIMAGRDESMLAGLALGADAAVGSTYNYAPRIYQNVIAEFEKGNLKGARQWQRKSQLMVTLLQKYASSTSKDLMKLAGVDCGPVRLPCTNNSPTQLEELEKDLDRLELRALLG
jgi:N-acetylneuraminate lyase